jgi:predicted DNA-binding antitoxin AbrB/MazE fold protein
LITQAFAYGSTDSALKHRARILPEVIMLNEQAELTGTVHDGVIVLDEDIKLPEGQTVKIIIQPSINESASSPADAPDGQTKEALARPLSPLAQMLLSHAGTVEGLPPDFALNHDHYLYGADKR